MGFAYFEPNGAAFIQEQIDAAVASGENTCEIAGIYEIEKTIVIPSNFTLVLNGAHLKMKSETFCRMFMNAAAVRRENERIFDTDENIRVLGKNGAIIDGGEYNGLSERNYKTTPYHISVNNLLLFAGVKGFEVAGIKAINQRWWALNFIDCSFGKLHDIEFRSDYRRVENGVMKFGLKQYEEVYIKNSDGIDLRCGCHDIEIWNISGFTQDDTVALTALPGEKFCAPENDGVIHDVKIAHVHAAAYCTIVRLLNQGGTRLYNVDISDVFDTSADMPYLDHGIFAVRIGDRHRYGQPGADHNPANISIRGVRGRGNAVIEAIGEIENFVLEDAEAFDGCKEVLVRA